MIKGHGLRTGRGDRRYGAPGRGDGGFHMSGGGGGPPGGRGPRYEEWSRAELRQRAEDLGIENGSGMTKRQLIDALRNR